MGLRKRGLAAPTGANAAKGRLWERRPGGGSRALDPAQGEANTFGPYLDPIRAGSPARNFRKAISLLMAHSLSAKKRIRQNAKRNARNRWRLRTLRTAIRDFLGKLTHGQVNEAKASFQSLQKLIDKTAAKGVIHKNNAARRKSRLNKRLKDRATAAPKK